MFLNQALPVTWMRLSLLFLTLLLTGPAGAGTRVAVLVGANTGWVNDVPLRYAEEDARRLGAALTELGGFAEDDVIVLRTPTTEQLRAELEAVQQRLRDTPEEEALFVFYYSGHADDQHLHMTGEPLPLTELRLLLNKMPAAVKLGIFDACQSGALLAAKSGKPTAAFRITASDDLTVSGTAILTSSGANEKSVELRSGSVFTNHMVSGLRGAADEDGDLRVSLDEAYGYAYAQTLFSTAHIPTGVQRPAFDFKLKGNGRLYLSRLSGSSAVLLFPPGWERCFVTDVDERRMIAELLPLRQESLRLLIPMGTHLIKCVDGQSYRVARLDVKAGDQRHVAQLTFRRVPISEGLLKEQGKGREPVEALAQQLAERAERARTEHPELSLLLAAEALRRAASIKAQQVLRRGLERLPRASSCVLPDEAQVSAQELSHLFTTVLWNPEETWHTAIGADGAACVGGMAGGELTQLLGDSPYKDMSFSADGKVLVSATVGEPARIWEVATGRERRRLEGTQSAHLMVLGPGAQLLATADGALVRVWEVATGREVAQVQHGDFIHALAFSPDGLLLASASQDGTARLWEAGTGGKHAEWKHEGAVRALAFSPDGKRLATGSEDRTARIWDVATGGMLARLTHRRVPCGERAGDGLSLCEMSQLTDTVSRVGTVVFSPDGKHLATETLDAVAWLWDTETGSELMRRSHGDHLRTLAFSPDGKALAIASGEPVARLWSVETQRELFQLTQEDGVAFLQYSADGRYLMTLSGKGRVHIWDAGTGREFANVLEDPALEAALLSPSGQHLVAARQSRDGGKVSFAVYAWWAEDLVAQACGRLRRNLSQDEWLQYVDKQEPYFKTCSALP